MEAELTAAEGTGSYESEGTTKAKNSRRRGGRSRGGSRTRAAAPAAAPAARRSRGGRGRTSSRAKPPEAASAAPAPILLPPDSGEPRKAGGKTLSEAAWTYSARLQRIKDAPSRVKTLLNDIKNRAGSHGFSPEEILEELKRHHGVKVDAQGRVQVEKVKPAAEAPSVEENA